MRVIKFFVIAGAMLILAGLGLLTFKMFERSAQAPRNEPETVVEENIAMPPGGRVSHLAGMDSGGVATLVKLPNGGGQLLFFSSQGRLKRRVLLTPEFPPPPPAPRTPDS